LIRRIGQSAGANENTAFSNDSGTIRQTKETAPGKQPFSKMNQLRVPESILIVDDEENVRSVLMRHLMRPERNVFRRRMHMTPWT